MKIFGIGLSRTGTKSLVKALRILGYRAAHYDVGARALKLIDGGLTLDFTQLSEWDALGDTPAAAFYRELDEYFTHSKFVLTVREKSTWLSSCKRHYAVDHSAWQREHGINPEYARQLNILIYGRDTFDEQAFSEAYDAHVERVQHYFRDRPGDFIVMNIVAGEGWPTLCRFLDKPVPDAPFPSIVSWKGSQ